MTRRIVWYQQAFFEVLTAFIFVIGPGNLGSKSFQNIATLLAGITTLLSRRPWWFRGSAMCTFVNEIPSRCCE